MLGRPRLRKPVVAAAAALAVSCGGILVATAAPAMAASCNSGAGTTWAISHLGSFGDGSGGQQAVNQADSWGGGNACLFMPLTTSASAAAFEVESQTAVGTGGVLSYPNTGIGCSSGYCTTNSGLPFAVSANPDPALNWGYDTTNAAPGSKYDTMIDSEFSASCSGAAPPMNAAVAIYTDGFPSYKSIGIPYSGPTVHIDGYDWYTGHFLNGSKYGSQFVLAQPSATGVNGLTLGDFYQWVAANLNPAYMPSGDCLQTVNTGFEIWSGGTGLANTGTWISGLATATPTPTPTPSATVTPTATGTPTPIPSNSSTSSPSASPTDSSTPDPSASPTSS